MTSHGEPTGEPTEAPHGTRWISGVVSGTCPSCSRDLWGRPVDVRAETTSCVCGTVILIPLHGVIVRCYNVPDEDHS